MSDLQAGDRVIYSQLVNRKLIDREASFVRYQEIGSTPRRRMAVIKIGDTGRIVQVATTSICRPDPGE